MSAPKRLAMEYSKLFKAPIAGVVSLAPDEDNIMHWTGVISPQMEPYNKNSFKIEFSFPDKYPFQPPTVKFGCPIYHPNVDEKGNMCLRVIDPANWKPAQKIANVLNKIIELVHEPEPDHSLRGDVAELFTKDRKEFNKVAAAEAAKKALKRQ